MKAIEVSQRHLEMSDLYLRDACSGKQSARGSVDAVLDAGYMALLSVLTDEERRVCEHPSSEAVEIAARRLGINAKESAALLSRRYSDADVLSLTQVLEWAQGVRGLVRKLGIK